MPEAPTTEPWAGTPPVPHAFRPGALPEAYMAKIAEGDERLVVSVDPVRVREIVANLLANAVRHTPAGG